jgi:hypothetical protein
MRIRTVVPVLSLVAMGIGCDSTEPNPLAGTFVATSFIVTETGEPPMDVLALGGDLTITIAQDNSTSGVLTVPGEIVGGSDVSLSMAGSAIRTGNTVHFEQDADSFVRDLAWTFSGNTLNASDSDAGVSLAITLTRQ